MSGFDAVVNFGRKATRRLQSAHKPLVRLMRQRARAQEHHEFREAADELDRAIARVASGRAPIIVGPWLAEVGYEVLYWIPFLRWFQDAHGVHRDRLIVVSRGGMEPAYGELAGTYVDLFDLASPAEVAARNAERRSLAEGGGQKQSGVSRYDEELIAAVQTRLGVGHSVTLHPSMMFGLFRHVWYGNLPFDVLWRHTRYAKAERPSSTAASAALDHVSLPGEFIAVKVYGGPALGTSEATKRAVADVVKRAASVAPVVVLDTELGVDEHRDFELEALPGVISARSWMTPRTNLAVQIALIARSRFFLGTCGGLAWMSPFLGVPTVALYDADRLIAPHLFVSRLAGTRVNAADFTTIDLRALDRIARDGPAPNSPTDDGRLE